MSEHVTCRVCRRARPLGEMELLGLKRTGLWICQDQADCRRAAASYMISAACFQSACAGCDGSECQCGCHERGVTGG